MRTVCQTCMHHCSLETGQRGICGARIQKNGQILSDNYGRVTALALDPIEKKPLGRFEPGSMILSVGSFGCNLSCPFCQNHEISMLHRNQSSVSDLISRISYIPPEVLAAKAAAYQRAGNIGIAFTYNEPVSRMGICTGYGKAGKGTRNEKCTHNEWDGVYGGTGRNSSIYGCHEYRFKRISGSIL